MNFDSLVPLSALPSQSLSVSLGGQDCGIRVYQKTTGLFFDLYVAGQAIALCVRALNIEPLVRNAYAGFVGELVFIDLHGSTDPVYSGLGDRYVLGYFQ